MVSGDIVSVFSGSGVMLTFQPAVGVQVMITNYYNTGVSQTNLTNGTITSVSLKDSNATIGNSKTLINNTNYFSNVALGGTSYSAFTGIQI